MNDEDRERRDDALAGDRDLLRHIESDWQAALGAIVEIHEAESVAQQRELARIRRTFRRLAIWQVVQSAALVAIVVAGFVVQGQQNARDRERAHMAAAEALRNRTALCGLRHDLEQRVAGGERFLREHPNGIPGIPAGTLRTSINGQVRTIMVLGVLDCPAP